MRKLRVKVIQPNQHIIYKSIKNIGDGTIDIQLGIETEPQGQTFMVGAKLDGLWVPMILRESNGWWDRLSKPKRRFSLPESKKPPTPQRVIQKPKQQERRVSPGEEYWAQLSRRPARQFPKKPEAIYKRGRSPALNLERPWWNRLSQLSWIQAEALRTQFYDSNQVKNNKLPSDKRTHINDDMRCSNQGIHVEHNTLCTQNENITSLENTLQSEDASLHDEQPSDEQSLYPDELSENAIEDGDQYDLLSSIQLVDSLMRKLSISSRSSSSCATMGLDDDIMADLEAASSIAGDESHLDLVIDEEENSLELLDDNLTLQENTSELLLDTSTQNIYEDSTQQQLADTDMHVEKQFNTEENNISIEKQLKTNSGDEILSTLSQNSQTTPTSNVNSSFNEDLIITNELQPEIEEKANDNS